MPTPASASPAPAGPVIGVVATQQTIMPAARHTSGRLFSGVYESYLGCLRDAGALPVMIPLDIPENGLRAILARLDGLLLTGGGDIAPAFYGEQMPHPTLRGINEARDATEFAVSRWAVQHDVPLLGICRGHQMLNVALGGKLITDVPSQRPSEVVHDEPEDLPLDYPAHEVLVEPGSLLARALGSERVITNSRHHQAVREVGVGLVVTARAPDGLIEATEKPDARFILSVQWHPENMCSGDAAMRSLFASLVAAGQDILRQRHNGA